eukprot:15365871-Ditylum_brightwellii.AAC.2
MVVPTDKINGHCLVDLNDYISWVKQHMCEAATPIKCHEIVKPHHLAINYAKELEDLLSDTKLAFLDEGINSRDIPESQLLIKDHKKHKGYHFPIHNVIPTTNLAAIFSKIGYMGIKKILDDNKIDYSKYTITQASDLKTKLESLKLKKPDVAIMSLNIVNMYPSTRLSLIKKAICFFSQTLTKGEETRIEKCINMIAFGMQTMLIWFQDQYYNYKGVVGGDETKSNEDDNGLAIGAYELAFCADISATYTYKMFDQILTKLIYPKSYRDDGLAIFEGKRT